MFGNGKRGEKLKERKILCACVCGKNESLTFMSKLLEMKNDKRKVNFCEMNFEREEILKWGWI